MVIGAFGFIGHHDDHREMSEKIKREKTNN